MKKIICIFIAVAMMLAMTACGSVSVSGQDNSYPNYEAYRQFQTEGRFVILDKDVSCGHLKIANNEIQVTLAAYNKNVDDYVIGETISGYIIIEGSHYELGGELRNFFVLNTVVFSDYN